MNMSLNVGDILSIIVILIMFVGWIKVIRSTTHPCEDDK